MQENRGGETEMEWQTQEKTESLLSSQVGVVFQGGREHDSQMPMKDKTDQA